MRVTVEHIINVLSELATAVENGTLTSKQSVEEFCKRVSKKQLEYCLTDDSLDDNDISACKSLLEKFYNYKIVIN